MASISTIKAISRLKELNIRVITPPSISNIFGVENKNTIYKIIERMEKYKLIERLVKGKYILSNSNISDFEKAGVILSPSYISLESALTFYGILPQFTYSITSVTTQKTSIDLIYLASKKLRKIDLSDLDMSIINWDLFNKLKMFINYKPFQNYIESNKIHD
ncbi:MAG: hypothetical protein UU16_C0050G0006 [Candidatus Woesebacteria bacterium GW2011_GWA2_40_7]|uniref:Transcriptional regulator n=1 Tax=Candidatus Woesebacteria bacterium GW2011_GWA2_40_7 TaxID=1618562 RepID=A0A0G0W9N9_9BACT|nr:MAG: hypothetical protein UU16_C0050G0006 [Candidatus Woesebacteria bacterium GW2011_GWA2_40_7]